METTLVEMLDPAWWTANRMFAAFLFLWFAVYAIRLAFKE